MPNANKPVAPSSKTDSEAHGSWIIPRSGMKRLLEDENLRRLISNRALKQMAREARKIDGAPAAPDIPVRSVSLDSQAAAPIVTKARLLRPDQA